MSSQTAEHRVLAGRYRLTQRLGVGGVGEVWRATDQTLGRDVAVKLLREQAERDEATRRRFRGEATSAASLSHPNAVTVFDIGDDDGRAFLVMEFVDGPSLDQVLRGGPIEPRVVAAVGERVAGALGEAHARGLVHRDVKPGNVLLSADGDVKVVDFGIAKALGDGQTRLTSTGTIIGTAAYLAPEQLRDDDIDARADVYALGLVLFECLTGRQAFGQGTPTEIAARRLTAPPRPAIEVNPDVPRELSDVIVRATSLEPGERYADGAAMARALRPVAARLGRRPEAAIATLVADRVDRSDAPPGAGAAATTDPARGRDRPSGQATAALPVDDAGADHGGSTRDGSADGDSGRTADSRGVPAVVDDEWFGDAGDDDRPDRARWVVVAGLLVAVLAVVVGLRLFGGGEEGVDVAGDADATPTASEASDGGGPVAVAAVTDHDPLGDGDEHGDEVALAVDGDPGTAWRTSRYNSPDLGGLKPGVGLAFDLGRPVEVRELRLSASPGVELGLYASDQPFQGAPTGAPVAQTTTAGDGATLQAGATGQHWLLWITRVSPDGRATVAEAQFIEAG